MADVTVDRTRESGDTVDYAVHIDGHAFRVTVRRESVADITTDTDALVRASFDFLLEREPVTSILRAFEITVIERYFPEWPEEMRRRLA